MSDQNKETLILEVKAIGADNATAATARLDGTATHCAATLSALTAIAGTLASILTAVTAATTAASAAHAAQATSNAAVVASTHANTAAITANTAATVANTSATVADVSVTEALVIATEANVVATTAQTASVVANTAALTANGAITRGLAATTTGLSRAVSGTVRGLAGLTRGAVGAGAAFIPLSGRMVGFLTPLYAFKKLIDGTRTFQDFQVQLETVTGSVEKATQAYSALVDYAIQTPYGLKQATDGFVKLVNFGLDPSERAMRSLGNIASGTAREFDQMVQAVAMATVNNFVRLKQFGILGRKVGDDVIFTFQGVTTRVRAESKAIQDYIMSLGETFFADAMSRRMQTLSGTLANLGDAWSLFWQALAKQGADNTITKLFRDITDGLMELTAQLESGQFSANLESYRIRWANTLSDIVYGFSQTENVIKEAVTLWGLLGSTASEDFQEGWKHFPELFRSIIQNTVNELLYFKAQVTIAFDAVQQIFNATFEALVITAEKTVMDTILPFNTLVDSAQTIASGFVSIFEVEFNRLVSIAKIRAAQVVNAFKGEFTDVTSLISTVNSVADKAVTSIKQDIASSAVDVATSLGGITESVSSNVAAGIRTAQDSVAALLPPLRQAADDARTVRDNVRTGIVTEFNDVKQQAEEQLRQAEELRRQFDATIGNRQGDRLAEFEKQGDGSDFLSELKKGRSSGGGGGGSRSSSNSSRDATREIQDRLRLVEEGLRLEDYVISDAYDMRRDMILRAETLTQAEREALALAALSNSFITEEQAVTDAYNRRRDIILGSELLTEQARTTLLEQMTRAREESLAAIEKEKMDKRLGVAKTFFTNLASVGALFGKKGFQIAKAASIVNATISTYESAVHAYKSAAMLGPIGLVLAPVAAAAAVAAGMANVASIKAQNYSGAYAHGGMIPSGATGLVHEAGPEIIRGPAVVTSASTTRSSHFADKGQVTVNVYNLPGQTAEVTTQRSSTGEEQIRIIIQKVETKLAGDARTGGGVFIPALTGAFGLTRS